MISQNVPHLDTVHATKSNLSTLLRTVLFFRVGTFVGQNSACVKIVKSPIDLARAADGCDLTFAGGASA